MVTALQLLMAHAIGDFGLQSEWSVKNKSRLTGSSEWYFYLINHGIIQGALAYFFTSEASIGIVILVTHTIIDLLKCEKKITATQDQMLHMIVIFLIGLSV